MKEKKNIQGLDVGKGWIRTARQEQRLPIFFVEMLLFCLLTVSMTCCFVSGFQLEVSSRILLVGIVVVSLISYMATRMKSYGVVVAFTYLLLFSCLSILVREKIANGLAIVVNQILNCVGSYYNLQFDVYQVNQHMNQADSSAYFVVFVANILVILLALLSRKKIGSYMAIGISMIVAFLPEVVGRLPKGWMVAVYIVVVMTYIGTGLYREKSTGGNLRWKAQLYQLLMGGLVIASFLYICPEERYKKVKTVPEMKEYMQEVFDELYDNTLRNFFASGSVKGGICFGQIDGVEEINFTKTPKLKVSYEKWPISNQGDRSLYLRGFLSGQYDGRGWKPIDEEVEQNAECEGVSLDDYDAAALDYGMKMENFFEYFSENGIFGIQADCFRRIKGRGVYDAKKEDYIKRPYQAELFAKTMSKGDDANVLISTIQIENVGETISTQFVPYYTVANIEERQGKLRDSTQNKRQQNWKVFLPEQVSYGCFQGTDYNYESSGFYYLYEQLEWTRKEYQQVCEYVEKQLGYSIADYKEGSMSGKTIQEIGENVVDDLRIEKREVEEYKKHDMEWSYHPDKLATVEEAFQYSDYYFGTMLSSTYFSLYSSRMRWRNNSWANNANEEYNRLKNYATKEEHQAYDGVDWSGLDGADTKYIAGGYEQYRKKKIELLCQKTGDSEEFYECMTDEEFQGHSDLYLVAIEKNMVEQLRTIIGVEDADAFLTLLKNMDEFYGKQEQYEEYVRQQYLQVPQDLKEELAQWMNVDDLKINKKNGWMVATYIQQLLDKNTQYSLSPGKTPEDKDFIEYFLFENKLGYCVHYASAATMMFRTMGIPARYVEGYLASKENLQDAKWSQDTEDVMFECTLTDENAHAWVEIYLDGLGWIPIEVTSGYTHASEEARNSLEIAETTPSPKASATVKYTRSPSDTLKPTFTSLQPSAAPVKMKSTKKKYGACMIAIGVVVTLVASVIGGLGAHYAWKRRKWRYKLSQATEEEKVYLYYKKIEKIFQSIGAIAFGEELVYVLKDKRVSIAILEQKEIEELIEIVERYSFSEAGVSKEDAEQIRELYERVDRRGEALRSRTKNIIWKYVKVE